MIRPRIGNSQEGSCINMICASDSSKEVLPFDIVLLDWTCNTLSFLLPTCQSSSILSVCPSCVLAFVHSRNSFLSFPTLYRVLQHPPLLAAIVLLSFWAWWKLCVYSCPLSKKKSFCPHFSWKAAGIPRLQMLMGWIPKAEILHDFQQYLPCRRYKGLHYVNSA